MGNGSTEDACNTALQGLSNVLRDLNNQLANAQRDVEHWRAEAQSWKARFDEELSRNERLHKVLRCAQRGESPQGIPPLLGRSLSAHSLRAPHGPSTPHTARPSPLATPRAQEEQQQQQRYGHLQHYTHPEQYGQQQQQQHLLQTGARLPPLYSTQSDPIGSTPSAAAAVATTAAVSASISADLARDLMQEQQQQHRQQQQQHRPRSMYGTGTAAAASCVVRRRHSMQGMPSFVDSLMSMFVAHSILQERPSVPDKTEDEREQDEPLASVSLDDDDGASGVGLAAAAAVSAAMAHAWASVASKEQLVQKAANRPGSNGGSGSKAGFRLVATVTNKMGKHRQSGGNGLTSQDSQDSTGLDSTGTSPSAAPAPLPPPSNGSQGPEVRSAMAAARSCGVCSTSTGTPAHIALHWLSKVRTVLAVRKLSPNVDAMFDNAVAWLRHQGITVYVEPSVYEAAVKAQEQAEATASSSQANSTADHGPFAMDRDDMRHAHAQSDAWQYSSSTSGSGAVVDGRYGRSRQSREGRIGELLTWPKPPEGPGSDLIPNDVASAVDLVVVLGGDGTVLWTCHSFGNRGVPPIVPFSMGSLGFLTPFQPHELKGVLRDVLKGGFPIQLRHRLHATVVRSDLDANAGSSSSFADSMARQGCGCMEADDHVVLNEVVVDRGISPFLTNLECYCDGNLITHVQGDGLIIATPTGSTAYNLAASGSMVHPQVPGMLFTPICPHSLSFRPLVLPDFVQLCIAVPKDSRSQVWCSFDGKDRTELRPGDAVIIRLSQWPVPTVCSLDSSKDWFSGVCECLHWNMRKMQGGQAAC